jgi:hypothetical protein
VAFVGLDFWILDLVMELVLATVSVLASCSILTPFPFLSHPPDTRHQASEGSDTERLLPTMACGWHEGGRCDCGQLKGLPEGLLRMLKR